MRCLRIPAQRDRLAKAADLYIGEERSRIVWKGSFNGTAISLDWDLATTPIAELAQRDVEVINLRILAEELEPLGS